MLLRSSAACAILSIFAMACSGGDDRNDDVEQSDDELRTQDKEYAFKYEFPANDLFRAPLTKSFPFSVEKRGVKLEGTLTPTAQVAVSSPVIEGKATIGKRTFLSMIAGRPVPRVLDAELKAQSTYRADLTVAFDFKWSTTEPKLLTQDTMRELAKELEAKINGGKAMDLALKVGEKKLGLKADDGSEPEQDGLLTAHYDVVASCAFDEIDGDARGTLRTGIDGTVIAKAVYNVDGVEKKRFLPDPTRKFELDAGSFQISPSPSVKFDGVRQHLKGSCSVQPSIVVTFADNVGVRLRVQGNAQYETSVRGASGAGADWHMVATPELKVFGEADITIPIVHKTIDLEKVLFSRSFATVDLSL